MPTPGLGERSVRMCPSLLTSVKILKQCFAHGTLLCSASPAKESTMPLSLLATRLLFF